MSTILAVLMVKSMKTMNPIFLAVTILSTSLLAAFYLYKNTNLSWISFVTILTFSSGMMTLFMYTASLSPNEKSKKSKESMLMLMIAVTMIMSTPLTEKAEKLQSMKSFSNKMMMMTMAAILIITLLSVSNQGHHPSQTVSSSF